jgi:hypothetical protein
MRLKGNSVKSEVSEEITNLTFLNVYLVTIFHQYLGNQVTILKLGDPIPLISGKPGHYFKTWRPHSTNIWKIG